ncbi:MAG: transcription termination/antitermination protein NusG [Caldilineaceae bacterium]
MDAEERDLDLQTDMVNSDAKNMEGSSSDELDEIDLEEDSLSDDSIESEQSEDSGPHAEWFVIHSYSGMENKVKKNIEHRTESMGMTEKILEIVVPTETEIEIRKGKRREVEKRVFPGYILVNMIMDEDSWYVVRNSPGVTGFVGMGNKPTPLRSEEVDKIMRRIESDEPRIKVSFQIGEHVRIMSGPFAEFGGTVDEIYPDKGKAKVLVSFFNRETPVEVDFLQLERDT